jgi:twitching motility protein PilT
MKKFNNVILASMQEGISDIHITGGQPFCFRKNGVIGFNQTIQWTSQEIDDLVKPLLNPRQLIILRERHSIDFAMTMKHTRLRINVFNTTLGLSLAVRLLPGVVPTLTKLNLHPSLQQICQEKTGLVLICGTTGCGKSTTIAAIIDEINRTRSAHIITLEDPIEYRFNADKSLIQQRELGTHIPSFKQGLLDVLREDPDVIVVGELREPETIRLTLHAAESGHLVIASLRQHLLQHALMRRKRRRPIEHVADEFDFGMRLDIFDDRTKGDARRALSRVAVDAGGDRGECEAGASILRRQLETGAIRACQQGRLVVLAIAIDRTDGVDDMPRGQLVPAV